MSPLFLCCFPDSSSFPLPVYRTVMMDLSYRPLKAQVLHIPALWEACMFTMHQMAPIILVLQVVMSSLCAQVVLPLCVWSEHSIALASLSSLKDTSPTGPGHHSHDIIAIITFQVPTLLGWQHMHLQERTLQFGSGVFCLLFCPVILSPLHYEPDNFYPIFPVQL